MPMNGHYTAELRQQVQELSAHCKKYNAAKNWTATGQLLTTMVLFFPLLFLMFWVVQYSFLWTLLLAVPAGGLLIRFFALQHDCGHGSFFSNRLANEVIGQCISILTFTPYDHWRRSHAIHHAGSGNLDRRGIGDIETLTVSEFKALSRMAQLKYRISRHPIVALVIGPPVFFLILQRLAIGSEMSMRDSWRGILLHNIALALFYGLLCYFIGFLNVLMVALPIVLVAAWIGGWLFFVQHQFEETLWEGADEWDAKIAALKGSSHLLMPAILNWFSCDIGVHHIHHLSSKIPNYRLQECLADSKELQTIAPTLTLMSALRSSHLALWDEAARKLISFRQYKLRYV